MKLHRIFAIAITLSASVAFAQTNPGSSPLSVPKGGTGRSTLTLFSLLYGNGTSPTGLIAAGTNNQALMGNTGSAPAFRALVGADLPAPGASSLGGVFTVSCSAPQFVTSLGGTGAFTCGQPAFTNITGTAGIDANVLNAKTANYTIAAADAGSTIYATGGPFTITLPAVAGFASNATVNVCNGDANDITHHAVRLSGFPAPIFTRLWMQQCVTVAIENGVWIAKTVPALFRPNFTLTLFIDTGGSDTNDGLVSNAAGNALRNLQACFDIVTSEMFVTPSSKGAIANYPICSPTSGQTFVGSTKLQGPAPGADIIYITGNGGVATLQPTVTTGQEIIQLSDFSPALELTNIKLDCTGGAHPCNGVFMNQYAILDLLNATINGGGSTDNGVFCNFACKVNTSTLTMSGTFGSGFTIHYGSTLIVNSGITIANSTTFNNNFIRVEKNSTMLFSGSLLYGTANNFGPAIFDGNTGSQLLFTSTFNTNITPASGRQWTILNNALLCNDSTIAIAGASAGINSTAGAANGIIAAATSGSNCVPAYP